MGARPELGGAEIAIILVFYGTIFLVAISIQLVICYFLYKPAKSLPIRFQRASPGQAFLMLIPLFSLVWLFIYPKNLSLSFQEFFRFNNQPSDDCGEQIGMYWAIASICSIIPCLGVIAAIASLVCMIMYLVKVNECGNRVLAMSGDGMKPQQPLRKNRPSQSNNPYDPNH